MQDFTGVPAVVDLAAMRDAVFRMGGDPKKINPLCPVDLVIVTCAKINHDVLVPKEEHACARVVELIHSIEARDLHSGIF